jgi:hypothetical protein
LTAAFVPTGMKAGVSNPPWRVSTRPTRARLFASRAATLKVIMRILWVTSGQAV